MNPATHETVILVAALLLLAALAWFAAPVLSPFVITVAIVYLLFPLRHMPLPGRIIRLSVALFALWFVSSLLPLLAPFIVAFLLAYLLNPVVSALERRRVPRWVSAMVSVLALIALVVAGILFLLPPILRQFNDILTGLGGLAQELTARSESFLAALERYGLSVAEARSAVAEYLSPGLESVLSTLLEGVFGFVTSISSVVLQLINALIIPFLVFYLLADFPAIGERFLRFFPASRRARVTAAAARVDLVLGGYLRGAIVVAVIQGLLSALGLWFMGVRYALVLGIMTAVLNFIPYVGLITSLVVASIVAILSGEPALVRVAGVVVLYLAQKLLEATVLAPKIIGTRVGLHPVLLILCLLVFGYFLGFIGLLIAVPATALIVDGLRAWEERRAETGG